MTAQDRTEQFVARLTASQSRIYAYILSLLPDPAAASDVLQETNIVLWRKAGELPDNADFVAWSCKVAYYQVLASLRDRKRDRHQFDDALLADVAMEAQRHATELDDRLVALRGCLAKLPGDDRQIVYRRYMKQGSVSAMARERGQTANAMSRRLYRIRKLLMDCIDRTLAATDEAGGRA